MAPSLPALLGAGVLAFTVSVVLTPVLERRAGRWALVDHPGGRKLHGSAVPATGGIALFWAVVVSAGVLVAPGSPSFGDAPLLLVLLLGAAVLHGIGLVDDRRGLAASTKLVGQTAAVLPLVVFQDMVLLPQWLPIWAGTILTVVWLLVVINAFNFLDGLDGLLGGVATICAAEFAVVAALGGQWPTVLLLVCLIGALAGFLPFNLPPARTFAGDNGSLVVGLVLAFASVRITYHDLGYALETPPHAVLTPLVILSLPLYDFASVVWLRIRDGRSPFTGDASHLSHRLRRRGLTPVQALVFICACTLATGLGGIVLMRVTPVQAGVLAVQALAVILMLALVEWTSRGEEG